MRNQRSDLHSFNRLHMIVAVLVFLSSFALIFYITGVKVNQYGQSDPLLTLPTAQALVQNGTPYLTHLEAVPIAPSGRKLGQVVNNYQATVLSNNEIVDVYSPGPALLVTPLVFLLDQVGFNLSDINTNLAVQNRLAFLTSAIALFSLFLLCLTKLDFFASLVVSHVTYFGSAMFANMGLAYFNINFTIVFIIWALIGLSRLESGEAQPRVRRWLGILIGLSLFLAFIQRPSSAILIVLSFGFLWLYHRPEGMWAMAVAAFGLAGFVGWSWVTYGSFLPIYYDTGKAPELLPLWVGLLGNLFSPSRGLFFTMPWLILVPILLIKAKNWLRLDNLIPWILVWGMLLLYTISTSVIWWGGASFGARLLSEFLPGLILIGITIWSDFEDHLPKQFKTISLTSFLVLGLFSVWTHAYQPFFNVYTGGPWQNSITGYPTEDGEMFSPYFSLKYSQLFATQSRVCDLRDELTRSVVASNPNFFTPLGMGELIDPLDASSYGIDKLAEVNFSGDSIVYFPQPLFIDGFLLNQGQSVRGTCPASRFYFRPSADNLSKGDIRLVLSFENPLNELPVQINGQLSGSSVPDAGGQLIIKLPAEMLIADEINTIELTLPEEEQLVLNQITFESEP